MLKTQALFNFLQNQPYSLCKLYSYDMEVQVNVSQNGGKIISGTYKGKRWVGFQDETGNIWKPFRIPWKNGEFEDKELTFDLARHAEGIGMTGWDWINKQSKWFGYDFDALIGHKEGLTEDELRTIRTKLESVDFVHIYSSTSGFGLHVYIFLENPYPTKNHTEHAALARAVLNKISGLSGVSLEAQVDAMGGVMWVWHRRAGEESFRHLKEGTTLKDIPDGWRHYLDKITKRKLTPGQQTDKDTLIAATIKTELDEEHIALIKWFEKSTHFWIWDDERGMLICHTYSLKVAHRELSMKGHYDTISTGRDLQGGDQNCFAFPIKGGGWTVRRHTKGTTESSTWFLDSSGWRTCYYNKLPSLGQASKLLGAVETEKDYSFDKLNKAVRALMSMDITVDMPINMGDREASLKQTPDGRVILTFNRHEDDPDIEGWAKKKEGWSRVFYKENLKDDIELPDNLLRRVCCAGREVGWFLNTKQSWVNEKMSEIKSALFSLGKKRHDIDDIMGQCTLQNWLLVSKPFQPEYPGNREWNKGAAQFRFDPLPPESGGSGHPTWDLVFLHIGKSLEPALKENEWFKLYGIQTGAAYLYHWVASMFQYPSEPLPYLFLYGPQNCGKSILHEALSLLMTNGVTRADHALTNNSGFNGELRSSILAVVEETNLSKKGPASDRIKDWVTGKTLSIRALFKEAIDTPNHTHWIQCANSPEYCPILPGDTRITVIQVDSIEQEIPKPYLLQRLEREAPAFLYTIINLAIPESSGRLRIPVIETKEKQDVISRNIDSLLEFCQTHVTIKEGEKMLFADFYKRFHNWLEADEKDEWTSRKVSKQLPYNKFKYAGNLHIANITFE